MNRQGRQAGGGLGPYLKGKTRISRMNGNGGAGCGWGGANCAGAPAGGLNSFYISYSTKMPALRVLNSAKLIRVEATAFNDAFQGPMGMGLLPCRATIT